MLVAPLTGPLASNVIEVEITSEVFFGSIVAVLVVFAAAAAGFLVWQFARTFSDRRMADALARMAQRYNLVIDDENLAPLRRYVTFRTRGGLIGLFLALLPFLALMFVSFGSPEQGVGIAQSIVSFAVVYTGSLIGTLVGGALGRRAAAEVQGSTRAARLSPLPIGELLDPLELRLVRLSALLSVPLTVALLALSRAPWVNRDRALPDDLPSLVVLSAVGTALTIALPASVRRIQRWRAVSGNENALAWSDALTAQTARDLMYLAFVPSGGSALLALMSVGSAFPAEWRDASLVVLNVAAPVSLLLVFGVMAVVLARTPERHVQRTLWAQFALNPNLDRPSKLGNDYGAAAGANTGASADTDQRPDAQ